MLGQRGRQVIGQSPQLSAGAGPAGAGCDLPDLAGRVFGANPPVGHADAGPERRHVDGKRSADDGRHGARRSNDQRAAGMAVVVGQQPSAVERQLDLVGAGDWQHQQTPRPDQGQAHARPDGRARPFAR